MTPVYQQVSGHRTRWVATPPPGVPRPGRRSRRAEPYAGPPSYSSTPKWGFPALAWRWPTTVPSRPPIAYGGDPVTIDRVRNVSGHACAMLYAVATLALFAAAGEIWRYLLLVRSRQGALSDRLVGTSDALVVIGGALTLAFGVLAAMVTLWWLHLARRATTFLLDRPVPRKDWQVLIYLLIPGVNLVIIGSVVAELEHAVLRRPVGQSPRPTRATVIWWLVCVAGGLAFAVNLAWRFQDGVQARADGVLITAGGHLLAVLVAVLTALLVRRLTTLMSPIDPASLRHLRVLRITGAPDPPLRATRPVNSRR